MITPRLSPPLVVECLLALIGAAIALRLVPFARLARWLSRPALTPAEAPPALAAELARILPGLSRRLPWRSLCFEQGIAAHRLLQRRGLATTLSYGAAPIEGQLKAHVWVRSGALDVVGCDNAADFAVLSQISNASSS